MNSIFKCTEWGGNALGIFENITQGLALLSEHPHLAARMYKSAKFPREMSRQKVKNIILIHL